MFDQKGGQFKKISGEEKYVHLLIQFYMYYLIIKLIIRWKVTQQWTLIESGWEWVSIFYENEFVSSTWQDDVLIAERKGPKIHSSCTLAPRRKYEISY